MQRLVEYADELVTNVGPRPGASQGEHQAAELIAGNLENLGLDTWLQEFSSVRSTGWVRILYYLLGFVAAELLFIMPSLTVLSCILAILAFVLLALDLLDKNPLNNLINKGLSQNVIARYIPDGADPRRKVVIVAHYDSSRTMLQSAPVISYYHVLLRKIIRICLVVLVFVALLSLFPFPEPILLVLSILGLVLGIILLIAAVVEIVNLFMPYNQGANCNASGVAALMGVAQTLAGLRSDAGLDTGRETGAMRREQYGQLDADAPARPRGRGRRERQEEYQDSSDGYDEYGQAYDERDEQSIDGDGAAAGIGGAAGSLFSKARGLFNKKAPEASEEDYYDEYEDDTGNQTQYEPRPHRGEPARREPLDRHEEQQVEDFGAGTHTEPAPRRAAASGSNLELAGASTAPPLADAGVRPRTQLRYERMGSTGLQAAETAEGRGDPSVVARPVSSESVAMRSRPTLAQQQARERALRDEGQERSIAPEERTQDGMPAWFVDAKKAAQKGPERRATTDKEPKARRSRYADVPLEYKPTPASGQDVQHTQANAVPESAVLASESEPNVPAAPQPAPRQEASAMPQSAPRQEASAMPQSAPRQEARLPRESRPLPADMPPVHDEEADASEPVPAKAPPTTLNADFTGIDRLASDPLPTPSPGVRLPKSATSLEHAAAAPTPDIPTNDRLRNLPQTSLNNSGMIPTQQATFDQPTLFDAEEQGTRTGKVSNTGSFAPLGATGIMKPVGEELLQYHEGNEQDIYIDDADESAAGGSLARNEQGDYSPNMVEIPQSRTKSFFGNLGDRISGSRKKESLDSSPSTWLGVDEGYDARTEGSQIGGWENFSEEDDDEWKGGAYGGEDFEDNARALARFSSVLIDKEVWLVAVGSHENKNAGIKNLLAEYGRELKSALVINLDGVGAGDLYYTMAEGSFRPKGTDHRLQGLIKTAADALGIDMAPTGFKGYNTEAYEAINSGARAISIVGLDGPLPAGWRWKDDRLDILDEDNLEAVADVVVEVIKSV